MVRALRWGSISLNSGYGIACVAFVSVFSSCIVRADNRTKTDIVYMMNGDKITCEVKGLQHGQLSVKPDYVLDTMTVDWSKVDHIVSSQGFVIRTQDGTQYTGTLGLDSKNKASLIVRSEKEETLHNNDVVVIGELGPSFLKRLSGNVDAGINFQRANSRRNVTVQTGLSYQSEERIFSLQGNSQFTSQQKTNNTSQQSLSNAFYSRIRETNWYHAGLANFLSSSEQKIDLRSTFGYGLARRFISTNHDSLFGLAGLSYAQEKDSP